jgi:hypothetical protein
MARPDGDASRSSTTTRSTPTSQSSKAPTDGDGRDREEIRPPHRPEGHREENPIRQGFSYAGATAGT